jgi:nucleoside-diphosphate-sugar epimerase
MEVDHLDAELGDTDSIAEWLAKARPTHIIHLAGLSHVVGDPLSFYRVNVLGTESLLEAIFRAGIMPEKVLVASSANIYGNSDRTPIAEDAPVRPMNHYALSKAAMEMLVQKWFERMPIIVTRPFNYTGVGQSEAFVIPKIVAAYRRRDEVIRLGNLDVARDISDVSYVCNAYEKLLVSDAASECFNICSGEGIALQHVINAMKEIAQYTPSIQIDPKFVRKDEIKELVGDPSRLYGKVGHLKPVALMDLLGNMYRNMVDTPAMSGQKAV